MTTVFVRATDGGAIVYMPAADEQQLAQLAQQAVGEPIIIETPEGPQITVPVKASRQVMTRMAEQGAQMVDLDQAVQGGQVQIHPFDEQNASAIDRGQGQGLAGRAQEAAPGQLGGLAGPIAQGGPGRAGVNLLRDAVGM